MRYALFLLTGFILLAVSLYNLKLSIDFINRSERATGTVTSLELDDDAYFPIFAVHTKNDGDIKYFLPSGSKPASWRVGEEAIFLYDPAYPHSPRIMSYFWLFNWSIVFMAMAIPLIIFGGGYYLFKSRIASSNSYYA